MRLTPSRARRAGGLVSAALLVWLSLPAAPSAASGTSSAAPSNDLQAAARAATEQITPAATRDTVIAGIVGSVWGSPPVELAGVRSRLLCLAPTNTLIRTQTLSTPASRLVVTPNVDTLYSDAWLDLRRGPVLIRVPAIKTRYYVLQLLDMYTNTFANIGTRQTGTGAGTYAVVGPGWHGSLPSGARRINAPTPDVWVIGRVLVRDRADQAAAAAVERTIELQPPNPSAPSRGTPPLPRAACAGASTPLVPTGAAFFQELAAIIAADPPPTRDAPILEDLKDGGIQLGAGGSTTITPSTASMLAQGTSLGAMLTDEYAAGAVHQVNGWSENPGTGNYGDKYFLRAITAQVGLGANVPKESMYFSATVDANGARLQGANGYVIRFAKGETPPVEPLGFWSITLYGPDHFLVANPENRYAIGNRTAGLTREPDGALDVYVGGQPPPGRQQNWLPAPPGRFSLVLRAYLPTVALQQNRWKPPGLLPSS